MEETILVLFMLAAVWAAWGPKAALVVFASPFVLMLVGVIWIELSRGTIKIKYDDPGCNTKTEWCAVRR